MAKSRNTQPDDDGDEMGEIIAEKAVYRAYPITGDLLDDGIENGHLREIPTASGGRFFLVAEIEDYIEMLHQPRQRRGAATNPEDEVTDETVEEE